MLRGYSLPELPFRLAKITKQKPFCSFVRRHFLLARIELAWIQKTIDANVICTCPESIKTDCYFKLLEVVYLANRDYMTLAEGNTRSRSLTISRISIPWNMDP